MFDEHAVEITDLFEARAKDDGSDDGSGSSSSDSSQDPTHTITSV